MLARTSELINPGGVNLYPSEVETVLLSHDAVIETAVFGILDSIPGEEIVAFVTAHKPICLQTNSHVLFAGLTECQSMQMGSWFDVIFGTLFRIVFYLHPYSP